MKVLQISKYYYPYIGGVEQVANDCATALSSVEDVEQKVFCFNDKKVNEVSEVNGVEVIRAKTFAKIASQPISFSYGKMLKKCFKEFEPDVVIFHHPNPFAAMYLLRCLKKRPNCKLVVYWHLDITKQKILGKLFVGQTNALLKRASKIIATSPNYIEGSKSLPFFREKCIVIPNCVTKEHTTATEEVVARANEIKNQNEGKKILFAVGRHVPYKGMEYLVDASKFLSDKFKVFIGGSGELTESLIKKAENDEKVVFTGRLSEVDIKAYMLACDVFCFPSITKNEAFGIALAEAMAFEKPAVTFTIEGSGVNYVNLNGVTGIEVENGNVEEYAKAITLLANDEELCRKYGKAAKERVEENFTFNTFKANLTQLINQLT